ncbi:uncharacterized protein LOC135396090 [Ornithodoros turicata]|uniref:uncharacterized protein LOC135396090 n=1 Tax=Ornithodoros turicata TaxID=34597 RepID=UPI00313892A1
MRAAISVEESVAVGLYRLCSTAEDRTIAHLFGIGRSTVNTVYRQFVTAVIEKLESEWLRMIRPEAMAAHLREFYAVTGFPQALGALDGCHFAVSPPEKNAVDYHNHKGWYSVILPALVEQPFPASVIEGLPVVPLIILRDQAFPMTPNLMKPYPTAVAETPEALFNYNLSKSRRIVENAFGRTVLDSLSHCMGVVGTVSWAQDPEEDNPFRADQMH